MSSLETNPSKVHLLNQHGSDDEVEITKPQLGAHDQEVEKLGPAGTVQEQPPRCCWLRPLGLIVIPAIITAYYGVIWVHFVQNFTYNEGDKYRTFSGSLIYYSQFIVGVFGLSWSKFGFLPFIALPLSSLVFEISDGYIKVSDVSPFVQERNRTTFNEVYDKLLVSPAEIAWLAGFAPPTPGLGAIYANQSVDQSEHSSFGRLPNTLPYAADALDLIYGTTSGFKKVWLEQGLISSREGKVLTVASLIPGTTVVYFVLVPFCTWALLSAGLALWYWFRKRPVDGLDGYTMLRKGAQMADELKENDEFMRGKPFYDSGTLAALPSK